MADGLSDDQLAAFSKINSQADRNYTYARLFFRLASLAVCVLIIIFSIAGVSLSASSNAPSGAQTVGYIWVM
jgi:hypothetical protein